MASRRDAWEYRDGLDARMSAMETHVENIYHHVKRIDLLLEKQNGRIRENEFTNFNTRDMARFIITSTWGALSISPSLSNSKEFKTNYTFILDILKNKTN